MDGFEELISFLTPREENEAIKSYQNTTAIACPACDEPFDDLVVCKRELTSLDLSERMDICVTTSPEGSPLIFTHKE
ncbi:MAG: hypothetical protein ABEI39_00340 [Halobacteriales archaeon]